MGSDQRRIGIFGMGLLGGSVALALRARGGDVELHAYDPDPGALEAALACGAADRVHATLGPWIAELDLGVLAAPVGALPALAEGVAPHAAPGSRWTDVGSVKGPIVRSLAPLLPGYVGGHPMAGRETPGIHNAHAGLLQNAVWVLTPTAETAPADLEAHRAVVTELGAYPLVLAPDLHDRLVARVSHVPYLLAVALNLLIARDPDHEHLLFLAAGGFRDVTRVASGAPAMSRDMVSENRDAVREALDDLEGILADLRARLDAPESLLDAAWEAKRTRDALPVVKRALLPQLFDLFLALADQPLELARLTTLLGEAGVNIRDIEVIKIRGAGGEAIRVGFADGEGRDRACEVLTAAGYRIRAT